jgi:hypothetical protein
MIKLLLSAGMGLMLVSTSANAGEHRAGHAGYHPGGGVTVSTPGGGRGGRSSGGSQVVKVQPAPNVPQQKNWGCCTFSTPVPIVGSGKLTSGQNVRDHRSVRR